MRSRWQLIMGIQTVLRRIEQAEKALENAAYASPNRFQPLYRQEKTERLRRIGRQAFEAEVEATGATMAARD